MWTIQYTDLFGVVHQEHTYEKQATAQLAATWRSQKRNQNWVAVEVEHGNEKRFA